MHRPNLDSPYLKLMIYGAPGSGKTWTSATAAQCEEASPVLMLSAAGNPQSIRSLDKKPDIISLEQLTDLNEPYDFLAFGQSPDHPFCRAFGLRPPYKTIIIDSISEVQRFSVRTVTGGGYIEPGNIPPKMERQHHGAVLGQMLNMANLFYSLEMNVIMTCLEWARQESVNGAVTYTPLLWGQSVDQVPSYALMVGRVVKSRAIPSAWKAIDERLAGDGVINAMFVVEGERYYAKDQYNTDTLYFLNPTIRDILAAIAQPVIQASI